MLNPQSLTCIGKDEFEKLLDSVNSVRNEPKMSIGNSANALRKGISLFVLLNSL